MDIKRLLLRFGFFLFLLSNSFLFGQSPKQILLSAIDDLEEGNIERMENKLDYLLSKQPFKGDFSSKKDTVSEMPSNARKEIRIQANRLYAIYFLRTDNEKEADIKINAIFSLKSNYETDARDPIAYVDRVRELRVELQKLSSSSASKKAEEAGLEAANMTVITHEEMIRRGYTHIEEVFHDLPGFSISNSKGITYSNIYQRGYRSSTATDRTLLLIDGVEDNELFSSIAYISRQYPISNIKRIEIIYGPSSTIYGSNAFAGVINIITKDGIDYSRSESPLSVNADVGYGSYNTRYADVNIGMEHNDFWFSATGRIFKSAEADLSENEAWNYNWDSDYYTDAHYTEQLSLDASSENIEIFQASNLDSSFYTVGTEKITPSEAAIAKAKTSDSLAYTNRELSYDNPTNDYFISAAIGSKHFRFGIQNWQRTEGSAPTFTDRRFASSSNGNMWNVNQTFVSLKYNNDIFNNLSLTNHTRYKFQSNSPNASQTQFSGFGTKGLALYELDSLNPAWETTYYYQFANQFRNEVTLLYEPNPKFDLVSGVEFRNSQIQANYVTADTLEPEVNGTIDLDDGIGANNLNVLDFGIYSQATWKPVNYLIFTAGLRLDNNRVHNAGYGTVLNPRLVAIYHSNENKTIIKAIYSEAFKDATNFQKFSTTSNRQLSNPSLVPEKVRNIELSLQQKQELKGIQLKGELLAYSSWYSNIPELQNIAYGNGTTQQYQAIGQIMAKGIQAQLNATYGHIDIWSNYSFTDANYLSVNLPVGDIANHQFNWGFNVNFYNNLINLNMRMNYVGTKKTGSNTSVSDNPLSEIDPYTVINSAISINGDPINLTGLSLQLITNNLFNTSYSDPGIRSANGITFASSTPQEERHFIIRLLYSL